MHTPDSAPLTLAIGIDNGVTGQIGFIRSDGFYDLVPTPIFRDLNYTKKKAWINRVDTIKLKEIIRERIGGATRIHAGLERPMVNPARFAATISAIRCLEATLIALRELEDIGFEYLDSKAWQGQLLPHGVKELELKTASRIVGVRMFPKVEKKITRTKSTDADALLMAEFIRRKHFGNDHTVAN